MPFHHDAFPQGIDGVATYFLGVGKGAKRGVNDIHGIFEDLKTDIGNMLDPLGPDQRILQLVVPLLVEGKNVLDLVKDRVQLQVGIEDDQIATRIIFLL